MSVDVEDYFHTEAMTKTVNRSLWDRMPARVVQNTERLMEIFADREVRATFFVLGWVAENFPALVQQIVRQGHEVGCHSYWHRPIYTLSREEFREDTRRAKAAIEDAAGMPVQAYRAPSFSLTEGTEWAARILVEEGFEYDSSVHPVRHDLYDNRNAPRRPYHLCGGALLEIPISTARLAGANFPVAGGGYFRILPYAYVRWGLNSFWRSEKQPGIFYIHPWEIDPEQPRLEASWKSRFRQYTGLARAEKNLERILRDFAFAPIREVFAGELRHNRTEATETASRIPSPSTAANS
jgi:polysaccharide deacetylase family protein (PEP-CTERM system associated)